MKYLYIALLTLLPQLFWAQFPTVNLDARQNYFDGGNPLPAGERWKMTGTLPKGATSVRVEVGEESLLFEPADYFNQMEVVPGENSFEFLIDYPLRDGKTYNFHFIFGQQLTKDVAGELRENIYNSCMAYLDQVVYSNRKKINFRNEPKVVYKELNKILNRLAQPVDEMAFSSTLLNQLRLLDGTSLKEASNNIPPVKDQNWRDSRTQYKTMQLEKVKQNLQAELHRMVQAGTQVSMKTRDVKDYPVEKAPFVLPINLGYAAVYSSGNFQSFNYATAPYLGVSLPFGHRKFGNRIALSMGIMLTDLTFENGDRASGPFVQRPIYTAIGIKALRIFRIQAGGVLLSDSPSQGLSNIKIRPMVGISAEINLWAGFNKKGN